VSAVIALTMPRKSRPASSRKNAHHMVKAFVTPERAPNDMGYRATIKGLSMYPASDYPDFAMLDTKKHRVVVELAKCQTNTKESCWVLFLLEISSEVRPSRQPRMLTPAPPVTQKNPGFSLHGQRFDRKKGMAYVGSALSTVD